MDESAAAALFFFLVALPWFIVCVVAAIEVIGEPFMGVWHKAMWLFVLFAFPIFGLVLYVVKTLAGGACLGLFETSVAKMRVFRVGEFLSGALLLGLLAVLLRFVSRSF